ncbi:sensor domain-containing protein [Deinococcus knuensis]|uniref:sensor domain-containing protein n=1 Tax=Deinococcus knuensis TaxID=1837380 RepID=UPI00166E90F5|nr:bifunctional diguanylate cyclase/phosphodiesterase [Deinococcus knuensis]
MLHSGLTFVSAAAQSGDGLGLVNADGSLGEVNAALRRLCAHLPGGTALRLTGLLHPDDLQAHQRAVSQVLTGQRSSVTFTARVHPDVPGAWVSVTLSHVRAYPQGDPAALLIVREAREQAQIQELQDQLRTLKAEADRWRFAVNGSRDGVWDWYPQQHSIFVSSRWKALLGYRDHEFDATVEGWLDLIHPDDRPGLLPRYRQHVALETEAYEFEHRMRHRSGHWVWVLLRGQVSAWNEDGTPERVTGTLRDVTTQVSAQQELRRTRDHLQMIMNAVPGLIGYKDRDLLHQFGNAAYQDWYGHSPERMQGLHIREVIGEAMYRQNEAHMRAALDGHAQHFERTLTDPRGRERHALFSYIPDVQADGVHGFFVLAVDITGRRNAELNLMEEREWARTTLNSIGDGVITTDPAGQVTFINPVAQALTGWSGDAAHGRHIGQVMHLTDMVTGDAMPNPLLLALKERRVVGMALDATLGSRDGQVHAIADSAAPIVRPDGTVLGGVIVFHDVTQARAMAARMSHLAQHDALTDLPNRVLLHDRIQQALARYRRNGRPFAVVFMDLDHFKHVNDSLGHHVGDELLRAVAARLTEQVRETDTVSRQGGDEFVLLLTELRTAMDVRAFTDRLEASLARPYEVAGQTLTVSFSIGIAMCPHDGDDVDTLLRHADAAMYQAKGAGRNRTHFFSPDLLASIESRHRLVGQLRAALRDDAFTLHYQPKVNAATRELTGVEALLRWTLPDGQAVSPAEFIPVAEESGLIVPLGGWVLREACAQARAWQLALGRAVPVAVNISGLQFTQADFVEQVRAALEGAQLDPHLLELEITESMLVTQPQQASDRLRSLRDLGVRLSIDDFGTGFSSLSYLKLFPVDMLKIDRAFVQDVTTDRNDVAIVEAVIGIGQALNLQVLAEGVETPQQVQTLLNLGCAAMQGYHFARPMPAAQAQAWLTDWPGANDSGC